MNFKKISSGILIALFFTACSQNKREFEGSADTTAAEANTADLTGTEAKLVKTANIDFEVKDAYRSCNNIASGVKTLGGTITHRDVKTSEIDRKSIPISADSVELITSYSVEAEMVARVPSETLDQFVEIVSANATLIRTAKLDVDDRSIEYLGNKLKQEKRQKILNKELKKDTLETDDVMQLASQQDAVIDNQMNNLRTDAGTRYSTVTLHLSQPALLKKQTSPNQDLSAYQAPVRKRLVDSLNFGLNILVGLIMAIIHIWPLILFMLASWPVYKIVSKRLRVKTPE